MRNKQHKESISTHINSESHEKQKVECRSVRKDNIEPRTAKNRMVVREDKMKCYCGDTTVQFRHSPQRNDTQNVDIQKGSGRNNWEFGGVFISFENENGVRESEIKKVLEMQEGRLKGCKRV